MRASVRRVAQILESGCRRHKKPLQKPLAASRHRFKNRCYPLLLLICTSIRLSGMRNTVCRTTATNGNYCAMKGSSFPNCRLDGHHAVVLAPPRPVNSDEDTSPLYQSFSEFTGRGGRGVRGFPSMLGQSSSEFAASPVLLLYK